MKWYAVATRVGHEKEVSEEVTSLCSSLNLQCEVQALEGMVLLRVEEVPPLLNKRVKKLKHSHGFFGGASPVVVPNADVEAAKREERGAGPRFKLEVRSEPRRK